MKYLKFTSGLVIGLVVGVVSTTVYFWLDQVRVSYQERYRSENQIPDYSGIQINKVIERILEIGEEPPLKTGDRFEAFINIWIYDPAMPGNKGKVLFQTPASKPENFTLTLRPQLNVIEKAFWGMKKQQVKEMLIPYSEATGLDTLGFILPKGAIIMAHLKVHNVL